MISSSEREPVIVASETVTVAVVAAEIGALPESIEPSMLQSPSHVMFAPLIWLEMTERLP
jgi:hypothetical protein